MAFSPGREVKKKSYKIKITNDLSLIFLSNLAQSAFIYLFL